MLVAGLALGSYCQLSWRGELADVSASRVTFRIYGQIECDSEGNSVIFNCGVSYSRQQMQDYICLMGPVVCSLGNHLA
jgi:hypothetical protein